MGVGDMMIVRQVRLLFLFGADQVRSIAALSGFSFQSHADLDGLTA